MSPLGRIITAVVTPFEESLAIDQDAFVRLLQHLHTHGSDGVVACGTTGEAATLTDEEHLRVIELAVTESPADMTVIAGVGSNDTRHAVHLTEAATELGADAILSVNPYYNRPSERGLIAHYEEVARATDKPILLYNIPQRTGANLGPEFLKRLAQIDGIVGVKQANDDEMTPVEGLDVYAGNDDALATVLDFGGPGGILTSSHIVGERLRALADEPERRAELHESLSDVFATMAIAPAAVTSKAALALLGLCGDTVRLPYVTLTDDEASTLRAMLERNDLL